MSIPSLAEFDSTPVSTEHFTVDNDAKANWALRKLGEIRKQIAEAEALAAAERLRIDMWLDRVTQSFDHDITYFEHQLKAYADKQRAEGRKTVELPHGKIKSRAVAAKLEVVDKELFLKWARESAPHVIKIVESPSMTVMNDNIDKTEDGPVFAGTGELVPGLSVVPASVSITIETD